MAGIVQRLAKIRSHYQYITETYGDNEDYDITIQEQCLELLQNPSKIKAYNIYLERIQDLYHTGFCEFGKSCMGGVSRPSQLPVNGDEMLQEIATEYLIDY